VPTFVVGSGVGDNYATFILTFPDVVWFKSALMGALFELTYPDNWQERGDVAVSFAVEEAAQMISEVKVSAFNPFPIGLILPFGSDTPPAGYLLCDGSGYPVTDYPELFGVIGYGFGGSSGTFNVPNMVNAIPVGSGDTFGLGDTGGLARVTLSADEIPSHSHSATAPTVIDTGHSHVEGTTLPTAITIGAGVPAPAAVPSIGSTAPALTGITVLAPDIGYTGGGNSHENMPPYVATAYIIYAGRI
jgi:microcystin-dependent protein